MSGRSRVPVVVVQQHRVLREAVQLRLESEADLEVIASVSTVADAAPVLRGHPDAVVVLDQPTAVESCHEVMAELRAAAPGARAVILLHTTEVSIVSAAINAGISGVLCSDTPSTSLVQAVRTVAGGVCVLDEQALQQLVGTWHSLAQPVLSNREREVLSLVAAGSSNAEIASQLYVSTETVKTHVAHVLRKLDVPNRGSAVEKATRLGLLVP